MCKFQTPLNVITRDDLADKWLNRLHVETRSRGAVAQVIRPKPALLPCLHTARCKLQNRSFILPEHHRYSTPRKGAGNKNEICRCLKKKSQFKFFAYFWLLVQGNEIKFNLWPPIKEIKMSFTHTCGHKSVIIQL